MNKREFAKIYRKISPDDVTIEAALRDIDIFLETLKEALQIEGKVKFVKKGTFEVISRKPRVISNPATRERMTVYPKKNSKIQSI